MPEAVRPPVTVVAFILLAQAGGCAVASAGGWPAWTGFKATLISSDGRVIDYSTTQSITTSEGEAYAMFFALVANDRRTFATLLHWTTNNLAGGDLTRRLPAWKWGRQANGRWQVLDDNDAGDADLWLAYDLLEAGRLWRKPRYHRLGVHLLWRIAAQSLCKVPGLGLMLMPGDTGFVDASGWRFNPSYLPPQLLALFTLVDPVWSDFATTADRLLLATAPQGLAPDWVAWRHGLGWTIDSVHGAVGSYAAVRVYLWIGMLAGDAPDRRKLQLHFAPMAALTASLGYVPEQVDTNTGAHEGVGPIGFSAALLPLLAADGQDAALKLQRRRLEQHPPAGTDYYDQVLDLFGSGWDQKRFRFDRNGRLLPDWCRTCAR